MSEDVDKLGKSFEMLLSISQKLDSFSKRIDQVESKLAKVDASFSEIDSVHSDLKYGIMCLDGSVKAGQKESDSHKSVLDSFQKAHEKIYEGLASFETKFQEVKKNAAQIEKGTQDGLNRVISHLEGLKSNSVSLADFESFLQSMKKRFDEVEEKVKGFVKKTESLNGKQVSLQDAVAAHSERHSSHVEAISSLHILLSKLSSGFQSRFNEVFALIDSKVKGVSDLIQEEVRKLRAEIAALPSSPDVIKEEISKALSSISLEASNSTLRSNQVDMLVKTLEKRVENLNLQVKQLGSK